MKCEQCQEERSHMYTHFEDESIHLFCDVRCCDNWLDEGAMIVREEVENPMINEVGVHDKLPCDNCNLEMDYGDGVVDENTDKYFCSEYCFEEWASDNFKAILSYYKELNVYLN